MADVLYKSSGIVKDIRDSGESRQLDGIFSTKDPDLDGDIVVPDGAELAEYTTNPVFCWSHNLMVPAIGYVDPLKTNSRNVSGTVNFASTQAAIDIFQLYKDKALRTFSIGFIPMESEEIEDDTPEDERGWFYFPPRKFLRWNLKEISAVNVPANPNALARMLKMYGGLMTEFYGEKGLQELHQTVDAGRLKELVIELRRRKLIE